MKWKYLLYSLCVSAFITSCGKDEITGSQVDFSTPYILTDNPDDPVAHRCYELFVEHNVPIFFNDTLSVKEIGKDYNGEPVYRYETLDINWEFTERTSGNYKFTYLETQEEQLKALDYAEAYLKKASAAMHPFSIMLLKEIKLDSEKPAYVEGMRTLFIGGTDAYDTEEAIGASVSKMVGEMVLGKVKMKDELIARFEYVSEQNHYYGKFWENDLGVTFSKTLSALTSGKFGTVNLNNSVFDEAKWNTIANHYMIQYCAWGMGTYMGFDAETATALGAIYQNSAAVGEILYGLAAMAAEFGFICGDPSYPNVRAPEQTLDLEKFVSTILELGAEGFAARYGAFPLVMQKYKILADYIQNDLGVAL